MSGPDRACSIPRPEPLDLLATVRFLRLGSGDPTWWMGPGEARHATYTTDGPVTLHLVDRDDHLEVAAWGPGVAHAERIAAGLVGAADRPETFEPEHPGLLRLAAKWRGLRLATVASAFDALVPTVFQQLVTFEEASAAWRRAVRDLGEPAPGPFELRLPPSVDALRTTPTWRWERAGLARRRAETLLRIGHHARRLEEPFGDAAFARRRWQAVPGIGPWTVEHALGLRCGEADAVLLGDATLPMTVSWALTGEREADDARLAELLAPFAPHRFRVVRLLWAEGVRAPRRAPRHRIRGPMG